MLDHWPEEPITQAGLRAIIYFAKLLDPAWQAPPPFEYYWKDPQDELRDVSFNLIDFHASLPRMRTAMHGFVASLPIGAMVLYYCDHVEAYATAADNAAACVGGSRGIHTAAIALVIAVLEYKQREYQMLAEPARRRLAAIGFVIGDRIERLREYLRGGADGPLPATREQRHIDLDNGT